VVLGNPVRKEFTLIGPRAVADGTRRLLICGGSRGARAINRAVCDALPALAPLAGTLVVRHQTGDADLSMVRDAWARSAFPARDVDVRPFIADMAGVYEETDLIVSRAGATTVAELTASGRPSVLIPFAAAAHDHQTFNARALVAAGAAEMIVQQDLTGEVLATTITTLLSDRPRLARMAAAARSLGRPDAAARIADLCLSMMGGAAA
jgi:UDP-N-acetylglucosamine--N-acetylmuramyl-(pentapeptide) pyrophosphoryl-undecaprenol N-acetylglucosamine transferase